MEKKIKQLFNHDILKQAAERYGIREDSMIELDGFQNFVFSGLVGDREVILRIAHITHRNEILTIAELALSCFWRSPE